MWTLAWSVEWYLCSRKSYANRAAWYICTFYYLQTWFQAPNPKTHSDNRHWFWLIINFLSVQLLEKLISVRRSGTAEKAFTPVAFFVPEQGLKMIHCHFGSSHTNCSEPNFWSAVWLVSEQETLFLTERFCVFWTNWSEHLWSSGPPHISTSLHLTLLLQKQNGSFNTKMLSFFAFILGRALGAQEYDFTPAQTKLNKSASTRLNEGEKAAWTSHFI